MSSTQDSNPANPMTRTVASTQSEMTEIILPNDTNTLGTLLGGRLMHFIDLTGAMAAYRHSRTHVVTAAMDHIDFIRPARLGAPPRLRTSPAPTWSLSPSTRRAAARRFLNWCPRRRTSFAAMRMPCAAASIARPSLPAAKRRGWPPPLRKTPRRSNPEPTLRVSTANRTGVQSSAAQ